MADYQAMVPVPIYGTNPWTQVAQGSADKFGAAQQAASNLPQQQATLGYQQMQYNALQAGQANGAGQYPTFQNDLGIGSQNPGNQQQPQKQASPTQGVGYTPYSLLGEANYR